MASGFVAPLKSGVSNAFCHQHRPCPARARRAWAAVVCVEVSQTLSPSAPLPSPAQPDHHRAIWILLRAQGTSRSAALQAQPHGPCKARLGFAWPPKPKALTARAGAHPFRIPQVRGAISFYPSAFQ